jgi:hypothetical protein
VSRWLWHTSGRSVTWQGSLGGLTLACRYEAVRRRTCGTCRCWELGDSVENVSFGARQNDDLSVVVEDVVIGVCSCREMLRRHRYLRYVWCVGEALLGACLRNRERYYLQGWLSFLHFISIGSINCKGSRMLVVQLCPTLFSPPPPESNCLIES